MIELLAPAVNPRPAARDDGTKLQRTFMKMPVGGLVDLAAGAVSRQFRTADRAQLSEVVSLVFWYVILVLSQPTDRTLCSTCLG